MRTALTFLLRRYCATDRADLRDALEPGLAWGLRCQATAETTDERAAWLTLFSEAAAISDDDRLQAAGADLIGALRQEWGRVADVGMGATSVDACLLAGSHMLDPQSIVPDAIDELERIVAAAYRPGSGLARSGERSRRRSRRPRRPRPHVVSPAHGLRLLGPAAVPDAG